MKLKKFQVTKLHGTLNKTIVFDEKLTILVGINGSGKTSVLNLIEWLLGLNIPQLSLMQFESVELSFTQNGRPLELYAKQSNDRMTIGMAGDPKSNFAPIDVKFMHRRGNVELEDETRAFKARYAQLGPEPAERPLWSAIEKLPKPIAISLDRRLSAEAGQVIYVENEIKSKDNPRTSRVQSPIAKVLQVTNERFVGFQSQKLRLNEQLKAKLVLATFQDPFLQKKGRTGRVSLTEIDRLQQKVKDLLSVAVKESNEEVDAFFQNIKALIDRSPNAESKEGRLFWQAFSSRFSLINSFAASFKEFETQTTDAYREIEKYLSAVNQFFVDSRKEVSFSESKGQLAFRYLSSAGQPVGEHHSISIMSSGERQILILMTFLAFVTSPNRIFIVDEPELSLHPKWQKEFLSAFQSLAPKGTQIVIATHSPEIVSNHVGNCVVLEPR